MLISLEATCHHATSNNPIFFYFDAEFRFPFLLSTVLSGLPALWAPKASPMIWVSLAFVTL